MMTPLESKKKELEQQLHEIENQLVLEREQKPEFNLAEALHTVQCHYNHTDGCDWFYYSWDPIGGSRVRYLQKARKMLEAFHKISHKTFDDMFIEIIKLMNF